MSTSPWGTGSEFTGGHPDGEWFTDVNGENCALIGDPVAYVCHGVLKFEDEVGLCSGAVIIQLAGCWFPASGGVMLVGEVPEAAILN